MQVDSRTDTGRFLGLDRKRKGTDLILISRTENGDHVAEDMMINFSESGAKQRKREILHTFLW